MSLLGSIAHAATAVVANLPVNPNVPGTYAPDNPASIVANVYQFALLLGGLLAFGAIVYGAVRYAIAAGNPSGQSDARDQITQALLGLLLLLGAYLILQTINPSLTVLTLPELAPISAVAPGGGGGGGGVSGGSNLADAAVWNQLSAVGITRNAGCPQTCLDGMRQGTISELERLKQSCGSGCDVMVNAGTEVDAHGEKTSCNHVNGYKADVQPNTQVSNYITGNCASIGPRSDDHAPQYRCSSGAVYARESSHWDMYIGC